MSKTAKWITWASIILACLGIVALILTQNIFASTEDTNGSITGRYPYAVRQAKGAVFGAIRGSTGSTAVNEPNYTYKVNPAWADKVKTNTEAEEWYNKSSE